MSGTRTWWLKYLACLWGLHVVNVRICSKNKELGAAWLLVSELGLRQFVDNMLKLFSTAALLGAAFAQSSNSSSLPTVDLGYEIYRAATFNVC